MTGRGSWGRKRRGIRPVMEMRPLRREYWRNLGAIYFVEARRLLRWESLAEGRELTRWLTRLTSGAAAYWRRKALSKGGGI